MENEVNAEPQPVPMPTPDEQLLQRDADAAAKMIMEKGTEEDAANSLGRLYHNLARLEKKLPSLVEFGFKLSHAVAQWAKEKRVDTRRIELGDIFWDPHGDIAFEMVHDPMDITPKEDPVFLKSGFARLPMLSEKFPCIVELVMTVGMHFTALVNDRRLSPRGLAFNNLHFFVNQVSQKPCFCFRAVDNTRRRVKPGKVNL